MPVLIQIKSGARARQEQSFDDSVDKIVIGRNSDRCQLAFPDDDTCVGREHCALLRHLGRYSLEINRTDVVLLNGKRVRVNLDELPAKCELQLGAGGPVVSVDSWLAGLQKSTTGADPQVGIDTILGQTEDELKRTGKVTNRTRHVVWFVVACLLLVAVGLITLSRRAESQSQLAQAVRAAMPSVYVVLTRRGDVQTPIATAWVIDQAKGLLATNAHVAAEFKSLEPNAQMIVRSPGPNPRSFVVNDAPIHPGYEAFQKLWKEFDPVRPADLGTHQEVPYSAVGCDVAFLHVADPTGLAPQLRLAETKELYQLQPGERVGDVGYPTEGQSQGGVAIDSPVPVPNFDGEIRQVIDYFRTNDVPVEQRLFVGHSLPTAGGSSGSPILNLRGEVIAIHCAGNPIPLGETNQGVRVNSAVIGFAQRGDLLRELLAGTAAKQMAARLTQWEQGLARHYTRKAVRVREEIFNVRVQQLSGSIKKYLDATNDEPTAEPVPELTNLSLEKVVDAVPPKWRHRVRIPSAGTYLLAAIADDDEPVQLTVHEPADGKSQQVREGQSVAGAQNIQYVILELLSPGTVEMSVVRATAGGEVRVAVLRGQRFRRFKDQRR
jgi:hypothetical protein